MKRLSILFFLFTVILFGQADALESLSVDIKGLACPFCINALITNLNNLAGVKEVRSSSDNHRILIVMAPNQKPDIALINNTIRQSGYTPLQSKESSSQFQSTTHLTVKNQPCSTCHK